MPLSLEEIKAIRSSKQYRDAVYGTAASTPSIYGIQDIAPTPQPARTAQRPYTYPGEVTTPAIQPTFGELAAELPGQVFSGAVENLSRAVRNYFGNDPTVTTNLEKILIDLPTEKREEFLLRFAQPGMKTKVFAEAISSLGYSAAMAVPALVGSLYGGPLGRVAGGALTYAGTRGATRDQKLEELYNLENARVMQFRGTPLSREEWEAIANEKDYYAIANKYAFWEAMPETLGDVLGFRAIRMGGGPILKLAGKVIGREAVKRAPKKLAAAIVSKAIPTIGSRVGRTLAGMGEMQVIEQVGETITGWKQSKIDADIYGTPALDIWESFKQQAPVTALVAGTIGLGGKISGVGYDVLQKRRIDSFSNDYISENKTDILDKIKSIINKEGYDSDSVRRLKYYYGNRSQIMEPMAEIIDNYADLGVADTTENMIKDLTERHKRTPTVATELLRKKIARLEDTTEGVPKRPKTITALRAALGEQEAVAKEAVVFEEQRTLQQKEIEIRRVEEQAKLMVERLAEGDINIDELNEQIEGSQEGPAKEALIGLVNNFTERVDSLHTLMTEYGVVNPDVYKDKKRTFQEFFKNVMFSGISINEFNTLINQLEEMPAEFHKIYQYDKGVNNNILNRFKKALVGTHEERLGGVRKKDSLLNYNESEADAVFQRYVSAFRDGRIDITDVRFAIDKFITSRKTNVKLAQLLSTGIEQGVFTEAGVAYQEATQEGVPAIPTAPLVAPTTVLEPSGEVITTPPSQPAGLLAMPEGVYPTPIESGDITFLEGMPAITPTAPVAPIAPITPTKFVPEKPKEPVIPKPKKPAKKKPLTVEEVIPVPGRITAKEAEVKKVIAEKKAKKKAEKKVIPTLKPVVPPTPVKAEAVKEKIKVKPEVKSAEEFAKHVIKNHVGIIGDTEVTYLVSEGEHVIKATVIDKYGAKDIDEFTPKTIGGVQKTLRQIYSRAAKQISVPTVPAEVTIEKQPWEMTKKEHKESYKGKSFKERFIPTDKVIEKKVGSREPKAILDYYKEKYPKLKDIKLAIDNDLSNESRLGSITINKGVDTKTGEMDWSKVVLTAAKNAPPETLRHEIEHAIDAMNTTPEVRKTAEWRWQFNKFKNYEHDVFQYDYLHRQLIKQALSEGKPVSPEVLKDYPDLQRKAVIPAEVTPVKAIPEEAEAKVSPKIQKLVKETKPVKPPTAEPVVRPAMITKERTSKLVATRIGEKELTKPDRGTILSHEQYVTELKENNAAFVNENNIVSYKKSGERYNVNISTLKNGLWVNRFVSSESKASIDKFLDSTYNVITNDIKQSRKKKGLSTEIPVYGQPVITEEKVELAELSKDIIIENATLDEISQGLSPIRIVDGDTKSFFKTLSDAREYADDIVSTTGANVIVKTKGITEKKQPLPENETERKATLYGRNKKNLITQFTKFITKLKQTNPEIANDFIIKGKVVIKEPARGMRGKNVILDFAGKRLIGKSISAYLQWSPVGDSHGSVKLVTITDDIKQQSKEPIESSLIEHEENVYDDMGGLYDAIDDNRVDEYTNQNYKGKENQSRRNKLYDFIELNLGARFKDATKRTNKTLEDIKNAISQYNKTLRKPNHKIIQLAEKIGLIRTTPALYEALAKYQVVSQHNIEKGLSLDANINNPLINLENESLREYLAMRDNLMPYEDSTWRDDTHIDSIGHKIASDVLAEFDKAARLTNASYNTRIDHIREEFHESMFGTPRQMIYNRIRYNPDKGKPGDKIQHIATQQFITTLSDAGITLKDVRDVFKGADSVTQVGDTFAVKYGNNTFTIDVVTNIDIDTKLIRILHGKVKKVVGGVTKEGNIVLKRVGGDKWVLHHEAYHILEEMGMINKSWKRLLETEANRRLVVAEHELTTSTDNNILDNADRVIYRYKDASISEKRAMVLEEMLRERELYRGKSPLHKLVQKIGDIVDSFVRLHDYTVKKLIREYEKGKPIKEVSLYSKPTETRSYYGIESAPGSEIDINLQDYESTSEYMKRMISQLSKKHVKRTGKDERRETWMERERNEALDIGMINEYRSDYEMQERLSITTLAAFVHDTLSPIGRVQKWLYGDKIPIERDAKRGYENIPGAAAYHVDRMKKWLGAVGFTRSDMFPDSFLQRFFKSGYTREQLDEIIIAQHVPEAYEHVQKIYADVPLRSGEKKFIKDMFLGGAASKMSTEKAIGIVKNADSQLLAFADEFRVNVIHPQLDMMVDGNLISLDHSDKLHKQFNYYAPMKGWKHLFDQNDTSLTLLEKLVNPFIGKDPYINDKDESRLSIGVGWTAAGAEGKIRKGRITIPHSPVLQSIQDFQRTALRMEKNRESQIFLKMVIENPSNAWYISPTQPVMEDVMTKTIEVKVNGKSTWVIIADPRLVASIKDLGVYRSMRGIREINGFLRSVNTVFNPEFLFTNFQRDIQTALVHIYGNEEIAKMKVKGVGIQIVKSLPSAMKAIYKAEVGKDLTNEWGVAYESFKKHGAKIGWAHTQDIQDLNREMSRMTRVFKKKQGRISGSYMAKFMRKALGTIENANTAVENGVRLTFFKYLTDSGLDAKYAANEARNLTVNFNRRGQIGPLLNSLYLFSNAGIQGTVRISNAMGLMNIYDKFKAGITKKSWKEFVETAPFSKGQKVVQGIVAGMVMVSFIQTITNMAINDEDYEQYSDYNKDNYWLQILPNGSTLSFKVPYGYNIFHVIGNVMAETMFGTLDMGEASSRVLKSFSDAFNPFGGPSFVQLVSPTVFDMFVQIAENKNFFGGPIKPEHTPYSPERPLSQLYFKNVSTPSKAFTSWLNRISGGTDPIRRGEEIWHYGKEGWLSQSPEHLDYVLGFMTGGLGKTLARTIGTVAPSNIRKMINPSDVPSVNKIPFLRQVYKDPDPWMAETQVYGMVANSGKILYSVTHTAKFMRAVDYAIGQGVLDKSRAIKLVRDYNRNQRKLKIAIEMDKRKRAKR